MQKRLIVSRYVTRPGHQFGSLCEMSVESCCLGRGLFSTRLLVIRSAGSSRSRLVPNSVPHSKRNEQA